MSTITIFVLSKVPKWNLKFFSQFLYNIYNIRHRWAPSNQGGIKKYGNTTSGIGGHLLPTREGLRNTVIRRKFRHEA